MLFGRYWKACGMKLGQQRCLLKCGRRNSCGWNPALDLAVCASFDSKLRGHPSFRKSFGFGRRDRSGWEIRAVSRIENRNAEAEKVGFQKRSLFQNMRSKGLESKKVKDSGIAVSKLEEECIKAGFFWGNEMRWLPGTVVFTEPNLLLECRKTCLPARLRRTKAEFF